MHKKSDALSKAWQTINTPIIAADAAMKANRKKGDKERTSLYRAVKRNARERQARRLAGGTTMKISSVKENGMSHSGGHSEPISSGNEASEKAAVHRHISRLMDDLPKTGPVKGIKLTKKTVSVKPVAKVTKVKKPVTVCDLKKKAYEMSIPKEQRIKLAMLIVKQAAHEKEAFRIAKMLQTIGNKGSQIWQGGKELVSQTGKALSKGVKSPKSLKSVPVKAPAKVKPKPKPKAKAGGRGKATKGRVADTHAKVKATRARTKQGELDQMALSDLRKSANILGAQQMLNSPMGKQVGGIMGGAAQGVGSALQTGGGAIGKAVGGAAGGLGGGMSGMPFGRMAGTGMGQSLGSQIGKGVGSAMNKGIQAGTNVAGKMAQASDARAHASRVKLASDLSQAWIHYSHAPTVEYQKAAARTFVEKIASSDLPYQEKQAILGLLAKALPFAGKVGGGLMRGAGTAVRGLGRLLGGGGAGASGLRGAAKGGLGGLTHGAGRAMGSFGKAMPGMAESMGSGLGRFAQTGFGRRLGTGLGAAGLGTAGYALGRSGIPSQAARQAFGPMPWDAQQPQQQQAPPRMNTPDYYGR